jgi:putative flippase GtrA
MIAGHALGQLARRHASEFARYLAVGVVSALINTAIIVALTMLLGVHYLVAYGLTFVGVTLFGFALNRRWSFAMEGRMQRRELLRYYLVTVLATACAMAASEVMVRLGLHYGIAVFLAAGLLAPVNFIAHRCYSFATPTGT